MQNKMRKTFLVWQETLNCLLNLDKPSKLAINVITTVKFHTLQQLANFFSDLFHFFHLTSIMHFTFTYRFILVASSIHFTNYVFSRFLSISLALSISRISGVDHIFMVWLVSPIPFFSQLTGVSCLALWTFQKFHTPQTL